MEKNHINKKIRCKIQKKFRLQIKLIISNRQNDINMKTGKKCDINNLHVRY